MQQSSPASLDEIRDDFLRITGSVVYAVVATVDPKGRPRSRVMHPLFEIVDGEPVGWVISNRSPVKTRHLAANPHVSCTYWSPAQDVVYLDCTADWVDDEAGRKQVWDAFAGTAPPLGWNPAEGFGEQGWTHPAWEPLRLRPWRIQVFHGEQMARADYSTRIWTRES